MARTPATEVGVEKLADLLDELQGDPWLEFNRSGGHSSKMREQRRLAAGSDAGRRLGNQLNAKQRLANAIGAPQAVMNACQLHAYMSINDPKTKAMLSRSLGNTEVETAHESVSRSFGRGGLSRTSSTQRRGSPLITEDGINRLGEDTILIIPQNARPIKARKVKYYADRTLKKLVVDFVEHADEGNGEAIETGSATSSPEAAKPSDRLVKDNAYQQAADFITFMIGLRAEAEPNPT